MMNEEIRAKFDEDLKNLALNISPGDTASLRYAPTEDGRIGLAIFREPDVFYCGAIFFTPDTLEAVILDLQTMIAAVRKRFGGGVSGPVS